MSAKYCDAWVWQQMRAADGVLMIIGTCGWKGFVLRAGIAISCCGINDVSSWLCANDVLITFWTDEAEKNWKLPLACIKKYRSLCDCVFTFTSFHFISSDCIEPHCKELVMVEGDIVSNFITLRKIFSKSQTALGDLSACSNSLQCSLLSCSLQHLTPLLPWKWKFSFHTVYVGIK